MKIFSSVMAACVVALAGLAPADAADKPPIKLGVIVPLTGFQAAYGTMYKTSIGLAAEDINAAGGINGSKVELMIDDDQGVPSQSVLLFRKDVNEGALAVLGPISGTCWENVSPLANAMSTPAFNWTALKPGITKKPFALRLHPADDLQIPDGVAEFMKKYPHVKTVVIAGDLKEASGASGIEEFKKVAPKYGLKVIDVVSFETKTTDFSPIAIKIRALDPDALFLSAFAPNVLALSKELEAQAFDRPIVGNALIWSGAFAQAVGQAGKHIHTIGFNTNESDPSIPGHDAFGERFIKVAAETTNLPKPANVANTTLSYDAVMMLAGILRDKKIDGTTDPQKAREAIKDGIAAIKTWQGLNTLRILDSGDGYIRSHLLDVDLDKKYWKYALPVDQRINK